MKDIFDDKKESDRKSYIRVPGMSKITEVTFFDDKDQIIERK